MGIDVQLRGESGAVLAEVSDSKMILSRASTSGKLSQTHLLRYLAPWGDTIFNQAQAGDLGLDVREIMRLSDGQPLADLLREIEPLVDRLSSEVHLYLWFVGD